MKRLLVISHVLPFPGDSGQECRVKNSLRSLRRSFHVTFLTNNAPARREYIVDKLTEFCDESIFIDSRFNKHLGSKILHNGAAKIYSLGSSLKPSNYALGKLEFTADRLSVALEQSDFDLVLYQYWHAYESTSIFRRRGIPCVLDMHNILWRSLESQNGSDRFIPDWVKRKRVERYRKAEENAWHFFDAVIAINRAEEAYVRGRVGSTQRVFYTPMGIELADWPFAWEGISETPRVAFYGGLASSHNEQSALDCLRFVMPKVWGKFPLAQMWIIGSHPSERIRSAAADDERVNVTGYVRDVGALLKSMSVVVCPWRGRYGFRSRIVEVMATGVPIVASPDAIDGMEFTEGNEILLGNSIDEITDKTLLLLSDVEGAREQSAKARSAVERLYSERATYDRLSEELSRFVESREKGHVISI